MGTTPKRLSDEQEYSTHRSASSYHSEVSLTSMTNCLHDLQVIVLCLGVVLLLILVSLVFHQCGDRKEAFMHFTDVFELFKLYELKRTNWEIHWCA